MFVELHIIQSFPPSNLNRDDLGQPKDAEFGGYRRARISSQCLKRATRYAGRNEATGIAPLFERLTGVPLSARTHLMVEQQLMPALVAEGKAEDEARMVAREFARWYSHDKGAMNDKRPMETTVLLWLSPSEIKEIVTQLKALDWQQAVAEAQAVETKKSKAAKEDKGAKGDKSETDATKSALKKLADDFAKKSGKRASAPDIALFGRMLAARPNTNVDAACQVAHAISTHSIDGKTPIDYYTAMDDLRPKDEPGAGFLDVAYFNSACFYRYARLDVAQLKINLGARDLQGHDLADLPLKTVKAFLLASEAAIPGGKKNAHAQECRPSFMLAVVRDDDSAGWSLVNAFQRPIDARRDGDLVRASVRELEKRFTRLRQFYADADGDTVRAIAVALPDGELEPEDLGQMLQSAVKPSLEEWTAAICNALGA